MTGWKLVDLPVFGRPTRLVWRKRRWACGNSKCPVRSFTETDPAIAATRLASRTGLAGGVTEQVGRWARTVNEIAADLGCEWHTINNAVIPDGTALVDDDPDRIGAVNALGLDEVLFARVGPWRIKGWSTSIVDTRAGKLLDVIPGRSADACTPRRARFRRREACRPRRACG